MGACDLRYPTTVLDRANRQQQTLATVSLSVGLPHHFKGTHMSRFVEILNRHRGEITMRTLPAILDERKAKLEAEAGEYPQPLRLCPHREAQGQ